MDQKQHEVEQTVNILPAAQKSCSEFSTPTKKPYIHETPSFDVGLVTPTPQKTEETVNNRCKKENAKSSEKQAMDQNPYEVEEDADILPVAHKSCSELFSPTKKPQIHEISHLDSGSVSPTLEKTEETVNDSCKKEPAELPEKYKLLSELFDRMTTSLRLLNLRKQLPSFQNIRRVVEALTLRKFSYKNLAQIKFILPEAVQTDKILLHNKKTLCMEPDIKVTLLFDVVEGHNEHSDYIALSRLVSTRLFKIFNEHSEDYDVPEAELPEPFNRKEITISANPLPMNSSVRILPNVDETEPLNASHLPPSFKRRFSAIPSVKQETALEVANENTPMKNPLVINELNIETPDLSTPKRSVGTEDNKPKSMVNLKTMGSSLFAKRILDFSKVDEENAFLDVNVVSDSGPSAKN
ncbi:putative CDT1 Geminin-binding domain, winged helix DNA-binding domain superfamily [Helianthus annuus]|uniref:CDT1 Geminin-binding domain, winged helix DNA-binding domain superfamily n=2 Tax=Helianthus annuus TaxID=4232 RepID=A0A9K3HBZ0_HELAN|nr:CDT1-like protein a, chloroplastic [Helianthus annuus]KAF5772869.1 putative CDT1 Geminin-binding domain, winged helix DNA-binding domain superfamily [Helianthus annuus]KAJ0476437.1 putative CDT1 Geminin-binding domain, winged helix DNA-binding domain superfamily [Helianthus annuus]KAJ0497264.1 putative CDT1 Geminin-binding domain, winged helix DNA-binding domain superfamily [Helianthus annuus]KAJ0663273.1 putative CDT1 Geminin-binding domain, winged helix DNA-binding domain superfamily [Heli